MIALVSSKLFACLNPAQLEYLRGVARQLHFPAGTLVFTEGDPGGGLYVVKNGRVQISASINPDERRVFSHVGPGEIFGEMAILDQQPRSASASAEVDTDVYFIPRDPMLELLQQSPGLALELTREISGRLREFNRLYIREVLQAERLALVGRFASAIVHDLKNPLTIIRMAAEMAAVDNVKPESRRLASERIGKQVDRITHLINDILDFTRGASRDEALPQADYAVFVEGLLAEIRPEVEAAGVTLEVVAPPPAVKVALHPQRIGRVFYNLIGNAVDMMPKGGVIRVRFQQEGSFVTTEIQDTGPGIAPEIAARLFEPFATFGKPNGTGLGLSIVQRFIEEHGGRISARNLPAGGAAFTFLLPVAPAA